MRTATTCCAAACGLLLGYAQASAQPALVHYDGDTLLVRTFAVPFVPATGVNPLAPSVEPMEHQLRFRSADVRVFRSDGTSVGKEAWQAAFAKETAVRFTGYAIREADEPVLAEPKTGLSPEERLMYRKDTLLVTGIRSPVSQKPLSPGKDFPKGPAPRQGVASLAPGGRLRVVETAESRAHYPPRRDGGENQVENHIFKSSVTTITTNVRLVDVELAYAEGTKIPAGAAGEALPEETRVLISADGAPVHPLFLRLIRQDVIVVVIPQPATEPRGPIRIPPLKKAPASDS